MSSVAFTPDIDPAYNRLLWIDVETPCLDEREEFASLLQVAAIVTDVSGVPLADPLERVVLHTPAQVEHMRASCGDIVRSMHDETGLWSRLTSSEARPLGEVDADLWALVTSAAPERRQARLAGNSPVLDISFTRRFLPKTAEHLHYRLADVTWLGTSRVFSGLTRKRPNALEGSTKHDALSDILNAVNEYQTLFALDAWLAAEIAAGRLDMTGVPHRVRDILNCPEDH